jgi:hypothetical protein
MRENSSMDSEYYPKDGNFSGISSSHTSVAHAHRELRNARR